MRRLVILASALLAAVGCSQKVERPIPVNTSAPPDINITVNKDTGATEATTSPPESNVHVNVNNEPPAIGSTGGTVAITGLEHAIQITGQQASYTATTPSGYTVQLTPTPQAPIVGDEKLAVRVTAPNNGPFPDNLSIVGEVKDVHSGATTDSQWVLNAPGDALLSLNIPAPGSYVVDISLNIGGSVTDHAQFLMTVA